MLLGLLVPKTIYRGGLTLNRVLLQVRDMADGSATWIAKPSITNQAIGICIFDRVSGLRAALEAAEEMREWVVQRYAYAQEYKHKVMSCL
jgi:hypothetical protein